VKNADVVFEAVALFFGLSLISFGGIIALLPDVHRLLVETRGVMTSEELSNYVALAQASPGPNFLYMALFGFHVGGWWGALAFLFAVCAGPVLIVLALGRVDQQLRDHPWREIVLRGLAPVSVALLVLGVLTLTKPFANAWHWGLCVVATWVFLKTKWHPLLLFVAAALIGVALKL
jgi:chromate transporter